MLASMLEMNEKISVVLQMGPVVFVDFFRAPVLRALSEARGPKVRRDLLCRLHTWSQLLLHTLCEGSLRCVDRGSAVPTGTVLHILNTPTVGWQHSRVPGHSPAPKLT